MSVITQYFEQAIHADSERKQQLHAPTSATVVAFFLLASTVISAVFLPTAFLNLSDSALGVSGLALVTIAGATGLLLSTCLLFLGYILLICWY